MRLIVAPYLATTTAIGLALAAHAPAQAQSQDKPLGPVEIGEGLTLDPILNARIRIETVDQPTFPDDANAVTIRARAGALLSYEGFTLLAEAEGTGKIDDNFNDTIPTNGIEPFPVVADPESFELNRLAIGYARDGISVTAGRQRIIHDNARFLGNVGWRQNEQTFDAVRTVAELGRVKLDASFANSQRTIFGSKSPNSEFEGNLALLHAGADWDGFSIAAFSYLIDYDTRIGFSSQTYGVSAKGKVPVGSATLSGRLSYATQRDYGNNPVSYSADYVVAELSAAVSGFTLKAGYEELGSDSGSAAFQTPLATAHAFNGWADLFLVTPASGLRDHYVSASKSFTIEGLPKMRALVTYHSFDSDVGSSDFGHEWDALLAFKLGDVQVVTKYANYQASGFGVDTEKFWLQLGVSY